MKIENGKLVYLRAISENDLEKIIEWNNSKTIQENFGLWRYEFSNNSTLQWIKKAKLLGNDGEYIFGVCLKNTNEIIGIFGLDIKNYVNKVGEAYGYIGDEINRNKGFGTEAAKLVLNYAFKKLKLNSVYVKINDNNIASIRQYEKAGYQKVGVFHEHHITQNGKTLDVVLLEHTKSMWK